MAVHRQCPLLQRFCKPAQICSGQRLPSDATSKDHRALSLALPQLGQSCPVICFSCLAYTQNPVGPSLQRVSSANVAAHLPMAKQNRGTSTYSAKDVQHINNPATRKPHSFMAIAAILVAELMGQFIQQPTIHTWQRFLAACSGLDPDRP